MRVSLLISALSLTFASQAHALNLHWNDVSCSGNAARVFTPTSFVPEAGVERINAYSEEGEVRLVIRKEESTTTFRLSRVEDEVDNLGRVTQVYENRTVKLKLAYEGDTNTKLELLKLNSARDKLILRVGCNSN